MAKSDQTGGKSTASRKGRRNRVPREKTRALHSRASAVHPVMTWWAKSQNGRRVSRKMTIAPSRPR